MKAGDIVRFKSITLEPPWKIGLLIEYMPWEKIATILCEGKEYRVAARNVQKYGKRYKERYLSESG